MGGGASVQAEAVGGEGCGDDGEREEIGGGVGPEQAVGAEVAFNVKGFFRG